MKKRITLLSVIVLILILSVSLASCGDSHKHNWGDWSIVNAGNCTQGRSEKRVCADCAEEETQSYAPVHALGTEWISDDTSHWRKCINCEEIGTLSNHNLVDSVCTVCAYESAMLYTVTLDANGGEFASGLGNIVSVGSNGGLLGDNIPVPTKENYTFGAWYSDSALTVVWDMSTNEVSQDVTLYASWIIVERQVTFVLNYSGAEDVTQTTTNGLVSFVPQRNGYVFNGWWLGATDDSGDHELITKFDVTQLVTSDDLVLYASWRTAGVVSTPQVSVDEVDGRFNWDAVDGATGYTVLYGLYNSSDDTTEVFTTSTYWEFPFDLEYGRYTVKIRARGDGINTINSPYTTIVYSHKILKAPQNLNFNMVTSMLTWDQVDNASSYELHINGELVGGPNTYFDMSDYSIGNYRIEVSALRGDSYFCETATKTVTKKRLNTPINVEYTYNAETRAYEFTWDYVLGADSYIITVMGNEITVDESFYSFDHDSEYWSEEETIAFNILAFDSSTDYFISLPNEDNYNIVRKYHIATEKNINHAGNAGLSSSGEIYSAEDWRNYGTEITLKATTAVGYTWVGWYNGDALVSEDLSFSYVVTNQDVLLTAKWTYYTINIDSTEGGSVTSDGIMYGYAVEFNLNGAEGTAPQMQLVTTNTSLTYPQLPTRSGYAFGGWYDNAQCTGTPFDFTSSVTNDVTLYAQWIAFTGVNALTINSSITVDVVSKDSSTMQYYAFVPLISGNITIYSANGLSDTIGYLYDAAKELLASDDDDGDGSNFSITYNVIAGELYYIRPCGFDSSGTTTVYLRGSIPRAGGYASYAQGSIHGIVTANAELTITAATAAGYTWLGWYDGDTLISSDMEFTFNMPANNIAYTARWTYYTLTVESTDGGIVSTMSKEVSFNLNGADGTAPDTQYITTSTALVYPNVPTRDGYVFGGWYNNAACTGTMYDFSATVYSNVTLYARWVSYSGNAILPINGNLTVNVVSKDSSTKHYYAFVPLVSGQITLYSANGMSDTYGYLYNSAKSQLAYDDDSGNGNNFKITYNVTAGNLYYLRPCGYDSSGTTTVYLRGSMPTAGGLSGGAITSGDKFTAGTEITLIAETTDGYTWLGWYDGDILISSDMEFTFTMPNENVSYMAKWIPCPVTLTKDIDAGGSVSGVEATTAIGDELTITATLNDGYTFLGWYNGETLVSAELSFVYVLTQDAVTFTAKYEAIA